LIGSIVLSYVIGSIPFGVVASWLCHAPDPRTIGSGNIGFTNVLRVSGKKVGVVTLFGDFGKGFLVALISKTFVTLEGWVLAIVFSVIVGHVFSMFLQFSGGKGVATALGGILGLDVNLGGILIVIWGISVLLWKYSSGGALVAFSVLPGVTWFMGESFYFLIFSIAVAVLVIFRHTENIFRLCNGTESKISFSSS
jgi:glycerol-3-phosphate acyltransferase PlsY